MTRLWFMNADFEVELSAFHYRRTNHFSEINQRLARHLLHLIRPGDALLVTWPASDDLRRRAATVGVEIVEADRAASHADRHADRHFTPWGWTPSAIELGQRVGAIVDPVPIEIVRRVNSKIFSFQLEKEFGLAIPGAELIRSLDDATASAERACPNPNDKWVVKDPFGFAARERVLGRGPEIDSKAATWIEKRLTRQPVLIFQPWLDVTREFGVLLDISREGATSIRGFSHQQTNGAGTIVGFHLGVGPPLSVRELLESTALRVGERLFREGYWGPVGIDALEHSAGIHPLLEINARYTFGFVAHAIEAAKHHSHPMLWKLDD